ncbi:MAG: hypothetical protein IPO92_18530 [Saprospiraceae bacterium]|nr:hypothetical protein [Saprospiraceae bacterium]
MEKEVENTTSALNKFIKQVQSLVKSLAKEKSLNIPLSLSWNIRESIAIFLLNAWLDIR